MFDAYLRELKDRILWRTARRAGRWVPPNVVTLAAFLIGLMAAGAAWGRAYGAGLGLWLLNRLLDGLDGTIARSTDRQTAFGGFLDLTLDFVVYAAVPIGLALGAGSRAALLTVIGLLASFYVNATWMYLAAILERRRLAIPGGEQTSAAMPEGIIAGTETAVLYAIFFLWPRALVPVGAAMAVLVGATAAQRLRWTWRHLP
ncbi:MAG: CDP-alcohol phosphatidyltransferase family protein [Gemmatimonadota bacterium]|nr:CDP-alcohol phosphatidyltransferase family protein [Gemmatimonadota bacterium]MDE3126418.1 CDP-alcohol phosphatidyltransferase family protein [Gemmatimonadota bacterium]MDE3173807.1 CDP-alcohol phosphatidyltransferase family protein [Gemmatimonadota bacterium]